MLTLHHLEKSRSQRILWLFEELGLDYELQHYDRHPKTSLAPRELKQIHPLGKSPVVTDGDLVLAESAHIIEYILDEYGEGRLRPEPDTEAHLRYRYWMHYAEGSAMTPLVMKFVFTEIVKQTPLLGKPIVGAISKGVQASYLDREIETHVRFWDDELAERDWFVDDTFTAADIQMSFALLGARQATDLSDYPNVQSCLERIEARPASAPIV